MLNLKLADGPAGDQNWWSIPIKVPVMTLKVPVLEEVLVAVTRLLVEVPVYPYRMVRLLKLYFKPNWLEDQSAKGPYVDASKLALLKPPTKFIAPMGMSKLTARDAKL